MSIDYESAGALLPPQMNISDRGLVPTEVQTFRVRLPCSGLISAEVEVQLRINISAQHRLHNDTWLNFRRNKICLKGIFPPIRNDSVLLSPPGPLAAPGGPAAVAAGLAGLLLAVAAATSLLYMRSKKAARQDSLHTSYTTAAYGSHQNVFIRLDPLGRPPSANSGSYATIASLHKFPLGSCRRSPSPSPYAATPAMLAESIYSKPADSPHHCPSRVSYYACSQLTHVSQVYDSGAGRLGSSIQQLAPLTPAERLRGLAVASGTIKPAALLHEGTFGRVYSGALKRGNCELDVLIKTVTDEASACQVSLLLSEGTAFSALQHPHVLSAVAALVEPPRAPMLAYPLPSRGNLKRYLQSCRHHGGPGGHSPLTQELVDLGAQAGRGLAFLHGRGVWHKDVAARNCVIDEKMRLKLTDNALSRDLFPGDYHCLGDNENRPVKWLSLEALLRRAFGGPADVWGFGVLLWELTTLAQQPYAEVDPFEVGPYIRDGYRLSQPVNCPDELFAVMACCWLADPEHRPSMPQLIAYLDDFHEALSKYV